jgi:hypothetical protein
VTIWEVQFLDRVLKLAVMRMPEGGNHRRLWHAAALAAFVSALGCGAQPPAGVVETGSSVSRNGRTVDLKQICKNFFDQPTFTLNGVQYDSQRLQSEAPRHMDAVLPYNYPNGDLLAAVNCQLDTQTHRITRADLASGPPIDDKAVQYVRSQGLCLEDAKPK